MLFSFVGPALLLVERLRLQHPNIAGQYLNALTFYGTLFGKSPIGAAPPLITETGAGDKPLSSEQLATLQRAAHGAVVQCGKECGL